MKKLLIINGSPNRGGTTAKIIKDIIKDIDKDKIQITEINCYKLNINPCIDCKCCSYKKSVCSINDDMNSIYTNLKESDYIILASPMYFGMFSAPLKALIDRCQLIWSEKHLFNEISKPKKGIFIFNGGCSWKNMFEPMETIGRYFFNTINCTLVHSIYVENTDKNINAINESRANIVKCIDIISQ